MAGKILMICKSHLFWFCIQFHIFLFSWIKIALVNNVVDQLADAPQNFIQTIMKRFQRFRMQLSNFMLPQIQLKFKTRQGMDKMNMSMGSSEEEDDSKEKMMKMYERFCKPPYLKKSKRIKCKTTWWNLFSLKKLQCKQEFQLLPQVRKLDRMSPSVKLAVKFFGFW